MVSARVSIPTARQEFRMESTALAAVLLPFLLSRALLIVLTLALAPAFGHSPLALWNQWDGKWYVGIAAHGYHWGIHGKPALAFYPLYPLLIRAGMTLGMPGLVSALAVSNVAFFGALFYLYRLACSVAGPRAGLGAAWLLSLFPTAFFFFAPYSESLFLLSAIAAMYYAHENRPAASGLWAAAAVLTRPTGLIVLPAAVVAIVLYRRQRHLPWLRSLPLVTTPTIVAVATYFWYLINEHVSLAALLSTQRDWHRALTFPWTGFTASFQWLLIRDTYLPWALENLLQLEVTVLFLVLMVVAWRHLDMPARIYCTAFGLLVLMTPEWQDSYYAPFSSMDRFILVLFPLFIWLATRIPRARFWHAQAASAVLMLAAAAVHLYGGWVG
jgi:Gpi18-like mannosyltransferase